jgi:hypothetical protein
MGTGTFEINNLISLFQNCTEYTKTASCQWYELRLMLSCPIHMLSKYHSVWTEIKYKNISCELWSTDPLQRSLSYKREMPWAKRIRTERILTLRGTKVWWFHCLQTSDSVTFNGFNNGDNKNKHACVLQFRAHVHSKCLLWPWSLLIADTNLFLQSSSTVQKPHYIQNYKLHGEETFLRS